ncbi:MAG: M48 family metallopeptidase [Candidatus Colwellbacteria bacterium]|nr:M48 family metallopeptidase [Candidatus Colwellbacteria bacterium]
MAEKNGIRYTIKWSRRAKRLKVALYYDGRCVATVPVGFDIRIVENFIDKKSKWVLDRLDHFGKIRYGAPRSSRKTFLDNKDAALALAEERIGHFNRLYGFKVAHIGIRDQKTRWGSCSRSGNLNFNYRIIYLPAELSDYIIVHELCHLGSFDHSKRFWVLVGRTVPNYLELRKELRKEGIRYF